MKRSELQRRTPLTRGGPIKKRRPRRETRPGPGRDEVYLAWVRGLPCLVAGGSTPCNGWPCHAHHAGPKRMDRTAIPLCFNHHNEWHAGVGAFAVLDGWNKAARRAWADIAIKTVQGWRASAEREIA